jgi:hypothetical protein
VAVGDLNGDDALDLITANAGSNDVAVLLGAGDGTFATATRLGVGIAPQSVVVGDVNGDGVLDLTTANAGSDNVAVLLDLGDGRFLGFF